MNLYRLSQTVNDDYDTYDSVIVCAASPKAAIKIRPCCVRHKEKFARCSCDPCEHYTWVNNDEDIYVEYLGKAKQGMKGGIVLASFNAG